MAERKDKTPASRNPVAKGLKSRLRSAGPMPAKKGKGAIYTRRKKHSGEADED